jgi:hypothetical protein
VKRNVRNPAQLALFFSFSFLVILMGAFILRFLELRTGEFRVVPRSTVTRLSESVLALRWALVPALYCSILLGLSYSLRNRISAGLSMLLLLVLSLGAAAGISWGLERLRELPLSWGAASESPSLGGQGSGQKGLILSQPGAAMILLKGPADPRGPRVVSLAGEPLIYQEVPLGPNNTVLSLPPLAFRNETSPLLLSLFIDFSLSAGQFEARFKEGIVSFLAYAGSLILLLVSLRCILDAGNWPLASLFVGALAFRGTLALETCVNTQEIQDLLGSFAQNLIPRPFISPLIFSALGLIILLYTILVHLVTGKEGKK